MPIALRLERGKNSRRATPSALKRRQTLSNILGAADSALSCQRREVSGPYHSVIGDREKCRGTFREIMVYDKNQAYPEWIVWYQRQM